MSIHEIHISEPWFSLINFKLKTVEARENKGDIEKMNTGDLIIFFNTDLGWNRKIVVEITKVHYYDNFQEYLEEEKLENCFPGLETIEEGIKICGKYSKKLEEEEKEEEKEKIKVKAITIWNYGKF